MKATRTMYPESSNRLKKKTKMSIWGKNTGIDPTPLTAPFTNNSRIKPLGI